MRHLISALFLLGAGCSGLGRVRDDGLDREFAEETLAGDSSALVIQYDPGFAPANILAVRMPDGTLVLCSSPYDTVATRAMVRGLRQRFRPSRIVAINVHFHPDGTGGNQGYALEGVETYGSELTAAELARRGPAVWQETARVAPPRARARLEATPRISATKTFRAEDGLRLTFGGESVQVLYPGAGHSPDNVVVYFPSRRLLYGGDLIRAARAGVGFRGDANLAQWPAAVRSLAALSFEKVVPGHGKAGGRELLEHTLRVVGDAVSRPDVAY